MNLFCMNLFCMNNILSLQFPSCLMYYLSIFDRGKICKDGTKARFQDGTEKFVYSNGEEFTVYADGTLQMVTSNTIKVIRHSQDHHEILAPQGHKMIVKD